jgi:hypothetical protein
MLILNPKSLVTKLHFSIFRSENLIFQPDPGLGDIDFAPYCKARHGSMRGWGS